MRRVKEGLRLLLLLLFLAVGLASGQQPEAMRRPFEIRIRTSEMVAVTDSLKIEIELLNTGPKKAFTIEDITVELPDSFVLAGRQSKHDLVTAQAPVPDFNPGTPVFRSVVIPRSSFWSDPKSCLLYRCTKSQVVVRVKYFGATGESSGEIAEFVDVHPRSSLMAVMAGGIAGVLLAALFSLLYRVFISRTQPRASASAGSAWQRLRTGVSSVFISLLYGSLATAVAILLLTLTTVSGFPVSVSVCDSLGGLVLGLFFEPVGAFIHSRISSSTSTEV